MNGHIIDVSRELRAWRGFRAAAMLLGWPAAGVSLLALFVLVFAWARVASELRLWLPALAAATTLAWMAWCGWRGRRWGVLGCSLLVSLAGMGLALDRVLPLLRGAPAVNWLGVAIAPVLFGLSLLLARALWWYASSSALQRLIARAAVSTKSHRWLGVSEATPARRVKALVLALAAVPAGVLVFVIWNLASQRLLPGSVVEPGFFEQVMGRAGAAAAAFIALLLLAYARRLVAPSAAAVAATDPRAPVLFLRSFKDDGLRLQRGFDLAAVDEQLPVRFEEVLEARLRVLGPVFAIARPQQALAPLGAVHEPVGSRPWQTVVEERMRDARLIVALLGNSAGLTWEMAATERLQVQHKLLLIVPPGLRAARLAATWQITWNALQAQGAPRELPLLPANPLVIRICGERLEIVTVGRLQASGGDAYSFALARVLADWS